LYPLARHSLKQKSVCPTLEHFGFNLGCVEIQKPFENPNSQRASVTPQGQRSRHHTGYGGAPPLFSRDAPCVRREEGDRVWHRIGGAEFRDAGADGIGLGCFNIAAGGVCLQ
jgi:hypothetical protein